MTRQQMDHEGRRGRHRTTAVSAIDSTHGDLEMARINATSGLIVDCSLRVHSVLGPGLLERTYQHCLAFELTKGGALVQVSLELPVTYDGAHIGIGYRIDLLVNDLVIVELKSSIGCMPCTTPSCFPT